MALPAEPLAAFAMLFTWLIPMHDVKGGRGLFKMTDTSAELAAGPGQNTWAEMLQLNPADLGKPGLRAPLLSASIGVTIRSRTMRNARDSRHPTDFLL